MKNFEKILFATDFSDASEEGCKYAIFLAKQFDAKLFVVHVINELEFPTVGFFPDHYIDSHKEEVKEATAKKMEEFCSKNIKNFENYESDILVGIPHRQIIGKASSEDVSVIVIGTHGRTGFEHLFMGSTAEKIVRMASCPVLTVRPQQ